MIAQDRPGHDLRIQKQMKLDQLEAAIAVIVDYH
jgi:hypothetical protein